MKVKLNFLPSYKEKRRWIKEENRRQEKEEKEVEEEEQKKT